MLLFLAQSFPDGWGGVKLTAESMQIHLADRDPQHHAWAKHGVDKANMKLRILLSYWYYKDTDLDALFTKYFTPPYPDVFADSGGFSAETQGAVIAPQEYAAWVKRWAHLFSVYANLDVIGDAVGTAENQKRLEDMGLAPLPVFHVGENWDVLEGLVERYSYVALGGMVPHMRFAKRLIPWLIKAFKIAQGRAVFHGFGATSWEVISQLPWYSVDSSSWGQGFRYGQVPVFDNRKGRFEKINLGDRAGWVKHAKLVRDLGFDPADFSDRSRNDRAKICAISALSYMKAEQWLRRHWGEIHIPKPGHKSGLNLHLCTWSPDITSGPTSNFVGGDIQWDAMRELNSDANQGAGVRPHLADTSNGINYGDAEKGLRLHLADARGKSGGDLAAAAAGVNVFLVEHSLDGGGVGDVSRAVKVLSENNRNR